MARQKKYSIDEIDRMRESICLLFGSGGYYPADRAAEVEDRLRTHMMNGTTPEELEAKAEEATQRLLKQAIENFYASQPDCAV